MSQGWTGTSDLGSQNQRPLWAARPESPSNLSNCRMCRLCSATLPDFIDLLTVVAPTFIALSVLQLIYSSCVMFTISVFRAAGSLRKHIPRPLVFEVFPGVPLSLDGRRGAAGA